MTYIDDFAQWKEEFSFFVPIQVRFSETDMFGHVNNVSSFIYFEEARIEFLKSIQLFTDLDEEVNVPIVADLQCDYHEQMYFDDKINVYVKANQIGNTSFDLHYMGVNQAGTLCLTGRGRMVYIDSNTGRPVSLSSEMKEKLKK